MIRFVAAGPRAFAIALAGAGAEPLICEDAAALDAALRQLALRRDVHLVFVAEEQAEKAGVAIAAFRARSSAGLLALPLMPSGAHASLAEVRILVEQATGASLI